MEEHALPADRLSSVHALRGIAVLAVCGLHFLDSHNPGDVSTAVREVAAYGFHGVTLFFVISGFVLPLALSRGGYELRDFSRFALKRVIRLEPPYLVTIAAVTVLGALASQSPGFKGPPHVIDWIGLALHVGYLAPMFDKPWLIGVFWTLLVEMQFYALIGLTFPLLKKHPAAWITLMALPAALVPIWHALPFHLPIFLIGTVAFAWRQGLLSATAATIIALTLAVYLWGYRGPAFAIASLAAAAFILWARPRSRGLLWLGTISYSLYLVHLPVGRKVINLTLRYMPEHPYACALIAFFGGVLVAYFMWRYIERPSVSWAGRIKYGAKSVTT